MKTKLHKKQITAGVIIMMLLWTFRPFSSPNMDKVHPTLSVLEKQYKKVEFYYWLDGGSVCISIIDAKGKTGKICIPRPLNHNEFFSTNVYLGNIHYSFENSSELIGYQETKVFITQVLRNKETPTLFSDRECAIFSGRIRDWITFTWRRLTKDDSYIYHEDETSIF